ncbi:SDR family NAD(P)-dependent oxidoreductase [Serratia fonticola]|nr:SDR family NAD(P)-dependent oxidoreductase [Serratia fonticola]CAI1524468.1 NADP-dependent 3-hydroxy acid dehydrogenase YdfG [Serratia fonticola]
MNKVWFITGAGRGFGRVWTEAALKRGDSVIATAREPEKLTDLVTQFGDNLLPVMLDVRDRAAVSAAVDTGFRTFGRIDVVVNNAGYGLFCPLENVPENDARQITETNILGSLWVIQSILPYMRQQRHGHVIQISSIAGLMALPGMAMYNATKWALEGMVETLANEVKEFGINVTLVEPGPHLTDWIGSSAVRPERGEAYPTHEQMMQQSWPHMVPADPSHAVEPMLNLVDTNTPPLRMLLGESLNDMIIQEGQRRLAEIEYS